jgi:hypothetical protein
MIFYIVTIDDGGNTTPVYADGILVTFDGSQEAKEYCKDIPRKNKRRV